MHKIKSIFLKNNYTTLIKINSHSHVNKILKTLFCLKNSSNNDISNLSHPIYTNENLL